MHEPITVMSEDKPLHNKDDKKRRSSAQMLKEIELLKQYMELTPQGEIFGFSENLACITPVYL